MFHGICISGTQPRRTSSAVEFTVHFGLIRLLARAIYIYPFGSSGDLFPHLEASRFQSCRGQAGVRSSCMAFCGLRQAFLTFPPLHLNLSTLAFKGMDASEPHNQGAYFRPKLQPEYRLPGTTLHIRWHRLWILTYPLPPFFIRRWIAETGPFSSGPLLGLYSKCFLLCIVLHSGRHVSLNDSHTKMKEQEPGRGGLDN